MDPSVSSNARNLVIKTDVLSAKESVKGNSWQFCKETG